MCKISESLVRILSHYDGELWKGEVAYQLSTWNRLKLFQIPVDAA